GLQQLSACLHNPGRVIHGEFRKIRKDGSRVWVREVVRAVHGTDDNIVVLIVCEDITERKRAEEQLLHDAFHDRLTGLPNRALFMDQLGRSLKHTKRREDYLIGVLLLDLDHFKVINDSLGHLIGDHLLIAIARRLETSLRSSDMVARLGGDEFAILLKDIKDVSEATFVTDRIQKTLTLPFNLDGHEVFTTASIGIALSSTRYDRPEDLLRNADTAMYRAKAHGRACHEVFDRAMHDHAVARLQLETDLRRAIERKELQLHYQPIVLLESGRIAGFEALVRWRHSHRGSVAPVEFIPVAEETGLIIALNRWMLREACRQTRIWQAQFPVSPPLAMSMNLSGKQFMQSDLVEQIDQILKETGLEPSSLRLEITESAIMEYADAATAMLRQLRSRGVQLCLDDFGTGYSSLSYLHHFPIGILKIDRSFVNQMIGGGEHAEIVRAIVTLAHNLGMTVVAEGVETVEQLAHLRALQCPYGQGYLFSEPVDSEAVDILMERHDGFIWGETAAGAGLWGVGITEGR
ncbi:MAG: putative bifunctional diguanylate cyclase/phosphodiesterase, partial [Nitrospiraceae bacterium]